VPAAGHQSKELSALGNCTIAPKFKSEDGIVLLMFVSPSTDGFVDF
jgi:hypothetical protein